MFFKNHATNTKGIQGLMPSKPEYDIYVITEQSSLNYKQLEIIVLEYGNEVPQSQ